MAVVTAVVISGLLILYKALKEPLDLVGAGIKKIFIAISNGFSNMKDGAEYTEVINYG